MFDINEIFIQSSINFIAHFSSSSYVEHATTMLKVFTDFQTLMDATEERKKKEMAMEQ